LRHTTRAIQFSAWLLALVVPVAAAAPAAKPQAWQSAAGKKDQIVFALTGDAIINRRLSTSGLPGTDRMFGLIRSADVAFSNFETLIHDFTYPGAQQSGGTYMGSPRFVLDELAWAGFDLFGLANNHSHDFGVEGMRSTVAAFAKTDLVYAGVGENLALARAPGYFDTPKGRVALLSITSSFPPASAAGPQRRDMPGRPGVNPLRHTLTYTVPQATYDTIAKLRGSQPSSTAESASTPTLSFAGARWIAGDAVGISSKADARDLREMQAAVRDADQQSDWVLVSLHAHESAGPGQAWKPAEFVVEFAHAMIDAGADMVVGHGHHMLRGIEVYRGKPIFYSLANFIFENDLVRLQPAENYDKVDLPESALPSEYYSARSKNDKVGFPADRRNWQSVVAEVVYGEDRRLRQVRLHPVALGFGQPRTKRGSPYPASADEAAQIFRDLNEVSAPFGTTVTVTNGVGILNWPAAGTN
jgi:poly-gamma-glutamate synthesis protein (capsule biosynthesis protein)